MLELFKTKEKTGQARILVVDDEPDLVSTIQCRLEWCNCNVITAANGIEGLEKAANERPDLILLDTNMPVMNGHEMLKQLRGHPDLKDIPVICLSSLSAKEHQEHAFSAGAYVYIEKPFSTEELVETIEGVIK